MARQRKLESTTKASKEKSPEKQSRVRRVASKAGRGTKRAAKPFAFLVKPFKTKPFRFLGRILSKVFFIGYFKASWQELKQVTWPNRKQTWQLTFAVFIFALVFGVTIAILDYGLDKLFKRILLS